MEETSRFNRKITKTIFISLLMLAGFALLIFQINFFLLVFAGVFFGVLLHAAADWLTRKLKLKYGLSLVIVLLLIVGVLVGMIMFVGPSISEQVNQMVDTLPQSIKNLKEKITQTALGQKLFDEIPDNPQDLLGNRKEVVSKVVGSFSTTVGAFANLLIILITGIFLASDPGTYKNGFIRLFPLTFRPRLSEVLDKTYDTLSLWMMAKLISMAVVGVSTAIGLRLLGIPLPYALALIAALFSFIPNIGPYLALAPALLIAFMEGTDKALYVVILYFGIQIIESYLITPLIEKKMVALPPALTLLWMVIIGTLTGILGLILAAPILAALIVIISELYVKDFLERGNKIKMAE